MSQSFLSGLLSDLWSDLQDPGLLLQLGVLAFCLSAGWLVAKLLRGRVTAERAQWRVMRFGVESFSRVLWPLLALAFVALAKTLLVAGHHVNLLRVAIPLLGSFALIRLAFYILRRVFVKGGQAGAFVLAFEKAFATLVWGGVALYITGLLPDIVYYLEHTVIPVGRNKVTLMTIAQGAASVLVTLALALWFGAVLEERLMGMTGVHSSLRVVMARMTRTLLVFLAVLLSLSLVGIDLTVLSVFGGALGVGLGLGLQKIVSSYVSGFVILIERSLAIGDMVTVDKFSGQVTHINTRYTVLRGLDGVETVVPNEMLLSNTVQNYSLTDRMLRLATRINVAYRSDVDQVLALMEQAGASVPRVLKQPAPAALLMKFDADGFELELGFWIADPENGRGGVISDVNRAIWRLFSAHGIEVPYPQREVRIIGMPQAVELGTRGEISASDAT
ncbi:mechanosensitive ion channel family protein [Noviherbaspirillum galbum]|uniref:Mechanosensitive ion channel n=1 Tax=Noviherbaspirillum galbum TaxID=2709383 RepID=A0A6B3SP14_9BURK|nr:mechanosensitive ion channel domain-containing protein [Noviherbaspirillum galbum]NEX60436.1 mechanosensitive ion channel [Noviherbaspirillum galbum]